MNQTPTNQVHADRTYGDAAADIANPLAVWRIGIAGGLTAILCCAGPTVLAGVRSPAKRLLGVLGIAVATYAMLYAVTTWLGTLA